MHVENPSPTVFNACCFSETTRVLLETKSGMILYEIRAIKRRDSSAVTAFMFHILISYFYGTLGPWQVENYA